MTSGLKFKPLALAFLVNLIISVEDKIKYK